MPKRMTAEERARQIDEIAHYEGFVHSDFIELATECIEHERKATLEAAAERARRELAPFGAIATSIDAICAAILRDEED